MVNTPCIFSLFGGKLFFFTGIAHCILRGQYRCMRTLQLYAPLPSASGTCARACSQAIVPSNRMHWQHPSDVVLYSAASTLTPRSAMQPDPLQAQCVLQRVTTMVRGNGTAKPSLQTTRTSSGGRTSGCSAHVPERTVWRGQRLYARLR